MKITAIESLRWDAWPRLCVVRVHSECGLVGLGETVDKLPGAVAALHGTIAPLALGQDALDIEGLWRFVMDNIMYHGYAGAELRALSAFEMALWDLLGKHYDAPLYHLLGGAHVSGYPPTTPVSASAHTMTMRAGRRTPAAWHRVCWTTASTP